MATTTVSDYPADTGHWETHDPDYATIFTLVGVACANNHPQVTASLLGLAVQRPTVVLF